VDEVEDEPQVEARSIRKNGCGVPSLFQLFAWQLFLGNLVTYALIINIALSKVVPLAVILTVLFYISFGATVYFTIKSTIVDPTDPLIEEQIEVKKAG